MAGSYTNYTPSQNVQSLGGGGFYGSYAAGGAGTPVARGPLDKERMGLGRAPQAEYPDGYLGTIRSRRDDRLLDSLKTRVNQKAYQRGVHRGERIDQSGYFWPLDLQPDRGLARQTKAAWDQQNQTLMVQRNAPATALAPAPHLVNDGKANLRADGPAEVNPRRVSQMANMRPAWK